jgi:glycosyltransferase involved in cell wall biosynthesis
MRVTQVLRFDAGIYRGGGEIKAERTREALVELGVEVDVFTPHTREFGDLVHFFGNFSYFWTIGKYCRDRRVPYVCSPIFVTPRSSNRLKWRAFRQRYLEFRGESNHVRLFKNAKELYFQTSVERSNALAYYGNQIAPQVIVPNGVEPRFAAGDPGLFCSNFGIEKPFVLQASVFNVNKHQLELVHAMKSSPLDLVLLGRPHNAGYFEACKRAAGPNVHFLGNIPHDDSLLPAAYAAADIFCLPSSDDIFANSAMEAAVAGCKLILGNSWGGQEIYGDWATWIKPGDTAQIRAAIEKASHSSHDPEKQREFFLGKYSWHEVAKQLKERYTTTLAKHASKIS